MLAILAESALRSLLLGGVVWIGLNLLRSRNPHLHMTSWAMVLVASLSMPLLMHWTTVTVTLDPLPLRKPCGLRALRYRSPCARRSLRNSSPAQRAARPSTPSLGGRWQQRSTHWLPACCC